MQNMLSKGKAGQSIAYNLLRINSMINMDFNYLYALFLCT
ncbi:UNVERIFIED_CONTAM: hypothetical protein NCL1_51976 [Trichonephila clavipes]